MALIKPQFEAGRKQVGKGGIVKDPVVHRQVLVDLLTWSAENSLQPKGLIQSPIQGTDGNVEFLVWLRPNGQLIGEFNTLIESVVPSGPITLE